MQSLDFFEALAKRGLNITPTRAHEVAKDKFVIAIDKEERTMDVHFTVPMIDDWTFGTDKLLDLVDLMTVVMIMSVEAWNTAHLKEMGQDDTDAQPPATDQWSF